MAQWYNSLTFPLTLKNFRDYFFNNLGITCENTTLVNDSMLVEKTIFADVISGTDIIKAICEINGVFGHIDRQGIFRFITLDTTSVYTINASMYKPPVDYPNYNSRAITQIQIRQEEGDIGVIVGTAGNPYVIEDNFLVYGKDTTALRTIANNILPQIRSKAYRPCKVECIGNPCMEVGDRVTIRRSNNAGFNTFVMQRTIKGLQALTDSIISEGDEYRTEEINGVHYEVRQLKGKSNVLERSIEETRSTITNVAEGLQSEITQTAEGIQIQIDEIHEELNGEIEFFEREGVPTLLNYPYWDFTTAIPCNNTIQLSETYTSDMRPDGDQFPHFYYSENDRKSHRNDICYNDLTGLSYKFTYQDGRWFWKEITDSEYTFIMARLSELEVTAEHLSSEYTEISLDLRDNYWTNTQTNSVIEQKADSITSSVSQTYQTKDGMSDYQTVNGMNSYYTKAETYKKAEIDATIDGLSLVYETQSDIEANYYPKEQLYTKSEVYTKGEINSTIEGLSLTYETKSDLEENYYPKGQLYTRSQLYTRTQLYTQAQINATINGLSSVYETQADLQENYYDKEQLYTRTQLYTKSEINQTIDGLSLTYETKSDLQDNYYSKTQSNDRYYDKDTSDDRYYSSSQASILIGRVSSAESDIDSLEGDVGDVQSDIAGMHTEISAKVNETYGNNSSQFSWVLRSTGFVLKNSGTEVFRADKNGINVTGSGSFSGNVTARSGYIGNGSNGFTIGNTFIRNGKTSRDETTNNGIYLGTDGIALGKGKFIVTNAGALTATSANITGNITATGGNIAGWTITPTTFECNCIRLQSDGNIVCWETPDSNVYKWVLRNTGQLEAKDAIITGNITATSGRIGSWNITDNAIVNTNIKLQGDGNIVCYASGSTTNYWWALKNNGSAEFKGNVTIAGYTTSSEFNGLVGNFNTLNAKAITTDNFTSQKITAGMINAGTITGSKLAAGTITGDKISADAFSGNSFTGSRFNVGTLSSTNSFIWAGGFKYTLVQRSGDRYEFVRSTS